MRGNIITDSIDIKRITRDYHEHLYANKFGNLDERDKFLGGYKLPKFMQRNSNKPNILVSIYKSVFIVKNLLTAEIPRPKSLTGEFYQRLKGEVTLCANPSRKLSKYDCLPTHLLRIALTLQGRFNIHKQSIKFSYEKTKKKNPCDHFHRCRKPLTKFSVHP